jgi:hypothetical protein
VGQQQCIAALDGAIPGLAAGSRAPEFVTVLALLAPVENEEP